MGLTAAAHATLFIDSNCVSVGLSTIASRSRQTMQNSPTACNAAPGRAFQLLHSDAPASAGGWMSDRHAFAPRRRHSIGQRDIRKRLNFLRNRNDLQQGQIFVRIKPVCLCRDKVAQRLHLPIQQVSEQKVNSACLSPDSARRKSQRDQWLPMQPSLSARNPVPCPAGKSITTTAAPSSDKHSPR